MNEDSGIDIIHRLVTWARRDNTAPAHPQISESTITLRAPAIVEAGGGLAGAGAGKPTCPTVTLKCNYVSFGQGKCGLPSFPSTYPNSCIPLDNRIWRQRQNIMSGSKSDTFAGETSTVAVNSDWIHRKDLDEACLCVTESNSGTCHIHQEYPDGTINDFEDPYGCDPCGTSPSTTSEGCQLFGFGECSACYELANYIGPCDETHVETISPSVRTWSYTCEYDDGEGRSGTKSFACTLTQSDEFTTEQLISKVYSCVPDYDDSFDSELCLALYDLSENEISFSISKFQYKFVLEEAVSFDVTVQWCIGEPDDEFNIICVENLCAVILAGDLETDVFECTASSDHPYRTVRPIEFDGSFTELCHDPCL